MTKRPWPTAIKAVTVIWLLVSITINLAMVTIATKSLLDFGSFAASGINLRNGKNPYSTSSPLIFEIYFPSVHSGGKLPNLNPPITLFVFESLPQTNILEIANLWRLLSFGIYIAAVLLLLRNYTGNSIERILWTFALAGFWHTVELGQIYTPLLLLIVLIRLNSLEKRDILAGILLGLLAGIKPNFLIWMLFLFASKNWKTATTALITFVTISAIPLLVFGYDVYAQWFSATRVGNSILSMPGNSSLFGLASRIGYPTAGSIMAVLMVVIVAVYLFRAPHTPNDQNSLAHEAGIIVSLLASPISWAGYTIFLLPIFLSRRKWSPWMVVAAAILSVPFILTLLLYVSSPLNFVFWGWFYGLALVICLVEIMKDPQSRYAIRSAEPQTS